MHHACSYKWGLLIGSFSKGFKAAVNTRTGVQNVEGGIRSLHCEGAACSSAVMNVTTAEECASTLSSLLSSQADSAPCLFSWRRLKESYNSRWKTKLLGPWTKRKVLKAGRTPAGFSFFSSVQLIHHWNMSATTWWCLVILLKTFFLFIFVILVIIFMCCHKTDPQGFDRSVLLILVFDGNVHIPFSVKSSDPVTFQCAANGI